MTSPTDIANRALDTAGCRATISSLNDPAATAATISRHYTPVRQALLRTAQWGFARKTVGLTLLGQLAATPPTSPYPWQFKYAYPADCLHMRYILPIPPNISTGSGNPVPIVGALGWTPWAGPSRAYRYLPAYDDSTGTSTRVLLTNVPNALAVYTVDVLDPTMWDALFEEAMVATLAERIVIPLSGNVAMKESFVKIAELRVNEARAADGNEAIASSDVCVDWLTIRNSGSGAWGLDGGAQGIGGGGGVFWGGYGPLPWGA